VGLFSRGRDKHNLRILGEWADADVVEMRISELQGGEIIETEDPNLLLKANGRPFLPSASDPEGPAILAFITSRGEVGSGRWRPDAVVRVRVKRTPA
jgi:hypothetical protein